MQRRLGVFVFVLVGATVGRASAQAPAPAPPSAPAAPAPAPAPGAEASLEVARVVFRGNRKVEDDALRVNLRTVPGATLTQDMLREDVRTIWRMGFFEDVQRAFRRNKALATHDVSFAQFLDVTLRDELSDHARWEFQVEDVTILKEVQLLWRKNVVAVRYTNNTSRIEST